MEHPGKKDELERYAIEGSQAAFSRIVERYIKLVYSTCFRELGHKELAEEATQAVFLTLAQKAKSIRSEMDLAPWLYTVAQYEARDVRRQEQRRMARETRGAEEMHRLHQVQQSDAWDTIEPALNDAISSLSYADRVAILLRYFNQMSLREVGQAMGTNEAAAQRRVSRALEKLRTVLSSRKAATISTVVLAGLLTERATYAVPAYLSVSVAQSAGAIATLPSSPPLLGGGGLRDGSALNPLIAKGLLIVSTSKIVAGAAAVVVLAGVAFLALHRAPSAPVSSRAITWRIRPATDPATQPDEQQIVDQTNRMGDAIANQDLEEFAALLSPSFVDTHSDGSHMNREETLKAMAQTWHKGSAHRSPPPVSVISCTVKGTMATLVFRYPGEGRKGTVSFAKSGGQWLISGLDE